MSTATLDPVKQGWSTETPRLKRQAALQTEVQRLQQMVQEQAAMIEDLKRRATEDELTGLLNRRGFEMALERALSDFNRYGHHAALLVVDMNDFKSVNDTLGHLAGDALLRHVAQILRRHTRESDIVARPGGDEFSIVLRENSPEAAQRKARELEELIAGSPCTYEGREITASASIGTCSFSEASHKADLVARADANMYRRKTNARSMRVMV